MWCFYKGKDRFKLEREMCGCVHNSPEKWRKKMISYTKVYYEGLQYVMVISKSIMAVSNPDSVRDTPIWWSSQFCQKCKIFPARALVF